MVTFDKNKYKELRDKFETICKRIKNYETARPLTTNETKLLEYKTNSVETFNNLIKFLKEVYDQVELSLEDKEKTKMRNNLKEK